MRILRPKERAPSPVLPCSISRKRAILQESHLAWLKIADQAGIGRSGARLVATDGFGRMDANALAETVAADRAEGRVPVMIAATAGTTNAGMIDPLAACAEIARIAGLWCHVEAAWAERSSHPTRCATFSPAPSRRIPSPVTPINGSRRQWAAACS